MDYSQHMQTLIIGGVVPDVMSVDIANYFEWADRGMLMDVTDIMEGAAREQKMTFMPIVPDELLNHGRYYVVPYNMCGVIVELNLDIFKQAGIAIPPPAGLTWDWVAQVAPRLARRSGHPDSRAEFFFSMPDMTSMLFSFGAKIFDDPVNPHRVLVNSPEAAEMCRFVRQLVATKAVISRAETLNPSNIAVESMFMRGQAAAWIMGLFIHPGMNGVPAGFNWDVAPFPAGPGGRRVTANGAYALGISPHTPHAAAARRFLRFFLSPEGIAILDQPGAAMPLFRELLTAPGIMPQPPDPPHRQYFVDTMESGMCAFPVHGPGVAELRHIIDSRLGQVSADPDVPIPVILKTLEDEIYRWLAREKQDGFYP